MCVQSNQWYQVVWRGGEKHLQNIKIVKLERKTTEKKENFIFPSSFANTRKVPNLQIRREKKKKKAQNRRGNIGKNKKRTQQIIDNNNKKKSIFDIFLFWILFHFQFFSFLFCLNERKRKIKQRILFLFFFFNYWTFGFCFQHFPIWELHELFEELEGLLGDGECGGNGSCVDYNNWKTCS